MAKRSDDTEGSGITSGMGAERYKPYPAYKDSGVEWLREVPEHWNRKRLKQISRIRYGLGQPPREISNGLPLIRATNVVRGHISEENMVTVDPEDVPIGRDAFLSEGEIIVVRSGAYTADSAIIPKAYEGAVAGYDMVVTVNDASAEFVAIALLCTYVRDGQLVTSSMRSAQPHLNAEELGSAIILLPPLSEQRAIAAFLDRETARIDALVAKKERLIELLQEKRTALISHAVTKGLDPDVPMKDSGVEWLGEIPAHWEVKRLKRLAFMQASTAITGDDIGAEGDYPVFGGNGVRGYTSSFTHEGEFPLIGRQGALCGCVNFATGKFWASEHAVVVRSNAGVNPNWLAKLLEVMSLNQYSQSAAQPGLSVETIGPLAVPVALKDEQRAIAVFLDRETAKIDTLVAKVREAIDRLKELRTALISAAVTGKIDVRISS